MRRSDPERRFWLDDPRHVTLIYRWLIGVCVALVGLGVFTIREAHFPWERWIGFYAFYGFVCCVSLVLIAKLLRRVLKRPEDYYDG